ncbi:GDI interacting protein 3 [Carabus blaptoides fortunei]
MAEKIKKFFAKKKADAKFKLAGPGHKLTESSTSGNSQIKTPYVPKRMEPSAEARQAADAALTRLEGKRKDTPFNTSLAAIQAQVKRELEAEKLSKEVKKNETGQSSKHPSEFEASPVLAVNGVYFKCPMISNEVLSKDEWKGKIKEFLYEQLEEERGLTACLIIQSCNNNREKTRDCIETLCKYLENLIAHPDEEKYHRIRMSNKVFCEKVQPMEGTSELLFAAGFRQQKLPVQDQEEDFLVYNKENLEESDTLQVLCDALRNAEPVSLELDRNTQALLPSQAAKRVELPSVFYAISPEEFKREQQLRTEAMEKTMQLRTKAMREKDELREMRKYRFALIRVRLPDGIFLQGTFAVFEPVNAIFEFVRENLDQSGLPFNLWLPTGQKLEEADGEKTLIDMRLVPATILTFEWDPEYADAINAASTTILKPDIMMLVQSL